MAEGGEAWNAYRAEEKRVNDNMMRLRRERLAREALPEMQGEKTKPAKPGKTSKKQNAGDRP